MLVKVVSGERDVVVHRVNESLFLDFASAQDHVMKPVEGVNSFHTFSAALDDPTTIQCRPFHSCPVEDRETRQILKSSFLGKEWNDVMIPLLKPLKAPGLQSIKQIELFDKWGKLIPEQHRQQYKYYYEDPGLEVRGAVKKQKKQAQEQRANRHRRVDSVVVDAEKQQQQQL